MIILHRIHTSFHGHFEIPFQAHLNNLFSCQRKIFLTECGNLASCLAESGKHTRDEYRNENGFYVFNHFITTEHGLQIDTRYQFHLYYIIRNFPFGISQFFTLIPVSTSGYFFLIIPKSSQTPHKIQPIFLDSTFINLDSI
jgi:hypothetical protein